MDLGLEGKVAVVTGAGRGIGAAIAAMFAAEGAHVLLADIASEAAQASAEAIRREGGSAAAETVDVTDAASVEAMVAACIARFGTVDILVNNAGFPRDALLVKMSEQDWDDVVDVVLKGAFLCTRAVMPAMASQKSGRIINIASRAHHGNPGQANYSSAKAGLLGFTRSQAREQGRFNVTVNAVAPGFVETPLVQSLENYERIKVATIAQTPIPRLGRPDDIAAATLFLASCHASWITGEVVHVTGGRYSN
jgi:3-oxoacyl-[acyl-carrier protein] reductase